MSKDSDVIIKLLKATHVGVVEWKRSKYTPTSLNSTDDQVGFCYQASIEDVTFLTYEFQYRHYSDYDEWEMYDDVRLEIIDAEGTSLHIFADDECKKYIIKLFPLVKYQAEKISEKINRVNSALDRFLSE